MASKNACEFPSLCPNNCNKEIKSEDDLKEHLQVCLLEKKFHALNVVLLELVNTLKNIKSTKNLNYSIAYNIGLIN